jgi:hypothetical protein
MDGIHSLKANTSLEETLTLQMLDKSIESDKASLLALKARRNSMVPISRLPPETLSEIFSLAQLLCLDSAGPNHHSLEWINMTYVCRYWRNIALELPRFWVYLPIGNLQWVQEMLKRSKDSSLVIISNSPHSDSKKSGLRSALKHVHRVRELSVRDISPETWRTLEKKILQKPAPRLEHFCLRAKSEDYREDTLFVTKGILCMANRLRYLELSNCRFHWDSNLLRSLTHLTLHSVDRDVTMPVGTRFVDILASMLELESLDLYDSLPLEKERQLSSASEGVHLARLRTLRVHDVHDSDIPGLESLFHSITFPPTAVVRVVCDQNRVRYTDTMIDFSGIISGLARSYSHANLDAVFQNLILCKIFPNTWGIRLKLFREALSDSEMIRLHSANAPAQLELAFLCHSHLNASTTTIKKVLSDLWASNIPLNDITQVFFAEDIEGLTSETIANTFGKLPGVRSVLAAKDAARPVLDAMAPRSLLSDDAVSSTNSAISLSFPCLSFVHLNDITFKENHLVEDDAISTEMLRHSLVHHRDHGVAIDKLTLAACSGVCEEDIALLKEVVVNVECDASVRTGTRSGGDEEMRMEEDKLVEENEEEGKEEDEEEDEGDEASDSSTDSS